MKSLASLALMCAATAVLVAGCSDSSTKPKVTDPYVNSRLLVSGSSLAGNLQASNQVIIDTRKADDYAAGHIPGAISLPISPGSGLFDIGGVGTDATDLKPANEIATALGAAGVSSTQTIVVYGSDIDWLVGRMFWMLEYVGATDVRMLDGGFAKWTADGRATSTTAATLTARTFTATVVPARLVSKADVLADYNDTAHFVIVDGRNTNDFIASRIPHAVNVLVGDFLNTDFTMKTSVELEAMLSAKGLTRDKTVITHCYVGYRSSQEYFCFRLLGFTVTHYDGSWAEWNADPNTPKQTGTLR
ncbi:MAG: rhodanese-like domain-containing protein [Candidatus Eisenbacteria bacterium]